MRIRAVAVALLVIATTGRTVPCTEPPSDFLHSVHNDFVRNNCWPEPFVGPDRQAVRAPFGYMVHNGWQRQNLLHDHYFDQTGQLNEAGRLKIQWIVTEVPPHHRMIYVHRSLNPQQTAVRLQSVQVAVAQLTAGGPPTRVVETNIFPAGWPADRVDMINKGFTESAPPPNLPATSRVIKTD